MPLVEIVNGPITRLVLSEPATRNAMSEAMAAEFQAAVREIAKDSETRVVVLTGSGEAFSGGGHLSMLEEKTRLSKEENRLKMLEFYSSFLCITELKVPVIAALNGHAIGAACCLSLAADIRIAAAGAKLGFNFVALGLHPGMGATYFLPRLIGPSKAAELLYTASIITAERALELGLVSEVVPLSDLEARVQEVAKKISSNGPSALRELKTTLCLDQKAELQKALEREAEMQSGDYLSAEFLEGITAAKEKRKPQFAAWPGK